MAERSELLRLYIFSVMTSENHTTVMNVHIFHVYTHLLSGQEDHRRKIKQ